MFHILDQAGVTNPAFATGSRYEDSFSSLASPDCILMFSGGRDSTLAAVRLAEAGKRLLLVTITSSHLVGADRVLQRLTELKPYLRNAIAWVRVQQPAMPLDSDLFNNTCLPCQRSYITVGAALALKLGCCEIALGYTAYQASWPEQSLLAVSRLRNLLTGHDLRLQLPVYDTFSKEDAKKHLRSYGLSTDALEQKCLKQRWNIQLPEDLLDRALDAWERGIKCDIRDIHRAHHLDLLDFCYLD